MPRTFFLAVTAICVSATAWAATPAETIAARQGNFKQMGRAQKGISDELKKPSPDIGVIRTHANTLANLGPQVGRWFPRGTGKESGTATAALPAVWQQPAQFNGAAARLTGAVQNIQRLAAGGNVAQIQGGFGAVGGACKGCHDSFKGDK